MAKNYTTGLIITGDASGGIRAIRATDDQLGKLNQSFDKGSKRTRNYRRGVDDASSSLNKLKSVAGPVAAAIAALGAGSFARGMIEESQQLETNLLRTQQLIETTGRTAIRSAEQMHEQARALALSTLQSTEGVMAAQQTLLTFRNITGDTFDQAIEGAVDLSSAMGMDLNSAVLQLGKALEDPVKGLSALSRSGTVFTDAQKDMVEEMVEANRTAEAQAFILGELAAQYGGVAATEAQGLVGAQDTFGQKVQEAKIELADQLNVVERSTALYNTASNTLQSLTDNMDTVVSVAGGMAALLAGRLAGSLATATAGMMATTTAAGALRGAMALLGGPIGLLIGAGGLLYVFRDELGLVQERSGLTEEQIEALKKEMAEMSNAQVGTTLRELGAELDNMTLRAAAAREELARLREDDRGSGVLGFAAGEVGKEIRAMRAVSDAQARIAALNDRIAIGRAEAAERIEQSANAFTNATNETDDNTDSQDENNVSTREAAKLAKSLSDATGKYSTELDAMRKRLQPGYSDAQQFAKGMSTINIALASGKIGMQEYARLMGLLQQEMQGASDDAGDLADANADAADTMSREWERFGNSVDDTFKDAFKGAFDSFDDFADRLKGAFENLLAELAYAAVKNEIKIGLGMGTSGPMSGGIGDIFGGGSSGGGLSGITDAISGGFSGIQWGGAGGAQAYGGTGFANAATQGTGATGVMGGSMQNFSGATGFASAGAGMAGGYVGTELGSSAFGKNPGSNYGATAGALAGTYVGGPIGAAIGGAIGGAIDSAFGSDKKTFDFDFEQGAQAGIFGDRQSELGEFGVTAFSDWEVEKQPELDAMLTSIAEFDNTLANAAIPDRVDAMRDSVKGFSQSGVHNLFGERLRAIVSGSGALGAESLLSNIDADDPGHLSNMFVTSLNIESMADTFSKQVMSDVAAEIEEHDADVGSFAAMERALQTMQLLDGSAERLNITFDNTVEGAVHAASSLAELTGGVQNLDALQSNYYQNFFSDAERAAHLQDDLTESLSSMGLQLPETRDGFRDLVEAQDLSTESGRENYASLLQVSDAFAQLTPATNDSTAATEGNTAAQRDAADAAREREGLERQLLRLQGDTRTLRDMELKALDPANRALQQRIWSLEASQQAAADAAAAEQALTSERQGLQRQLYQAQGDEAALRQMQLDTLNPANRALQQQIWALEDQRAASVDTESEIQRVRQALSQTSTASRGASDALKELQSQLSAAQSNAQQAWDRYRSQSIDIEIGLLEVLGDESAILARQRELELEQIDESLRPFQERLWALQDEAKAQEQAKQASQNYASELANIQGQLTSTFSSISQWIDQRNATSGAPSMNLSEAGDQFARQLTLAENGDRSALQGITQYADQYLAAGEQMFASGTGFQRIQEDVLAALEGLPDQVSAEEFLAQEFRDAINNDLAEQINIAITESQYEIDALIDFAANTDQLPADLRTILGESAHRLDSTLSYLLGDNELSNDQVQMALKPVNNLVSTLDYIVGVDNLSADDRKLALESTNTLETTITGVLGSMSGDARKLALEDARDYTRNLKASLADGELDDLERNILSDSLDDLVRGIKTSGQLSLSRDEWAVINAASGDRKLDLLADVAFKEADIKDLEDISKNTKDGGKSIAQQATEQLQSLGSVNTSMESLASGMINLSGNIGGLVNAISQLADIQAEEIQQAQIESALGTVAQNAIASVGSEAEEELGYFSQNNRGHNSFEDYFREESVWKDNLPSMRAEKSVSGWDSVIPIDIDAAWLQENPDFVEGRSPGRYVHIPTFEDAKSEYERVIGSYTGPMFATGGAFTNGIVSRPTMFDMAQMGEAGPEAIMPLANIGGSLGVRFDSDSLRDLPMPDISAFPLLNRNDQTDAIRDLINENRMLRKELGARLDKIEQHSAAAVQVQQAGFNEQINEQKRGNAALGTMASKARLEGARR